MLLRLLCLLLSFVIACACAAEPLGQRHHTWQGIPGLERTAKSRVFSSWFIGGPKEPSPENLVLLCYSDDQAKTFTTPQIMAERKSSTRCFDPTLWLNPKGRLWHLFDPGNKESAINRVSLHRKEAQAGDQLHFKKLVLLVTGPGTVLKPITP